MITATKNRDICHL